MTIGIALRNAARGWYVFPCAGKRPLTAHGFKDATTDEAQIREWWAKWPEANVAIACGASGLAVMDCDHGLNTEADFQAWREKAGLPETFTVRTGRRPEFGVQMYFANPISDVSLWKLEGCEGQIKSAGGYVMAAGSIHPDSKEKYAVLCDVPIVTTPDKVRQFKSETRDSGNDGGPITENRNIELTKIGGKLRNAGLSKDAVTVALLQVNADRCDPPMDEEEVQRIAASVSRYDVPAPVPEIVFGQPQPVLDWRSRYHTFDEMYNAPEPTFIIEGFLQKDVISAIAAPVGQRKTIIAANAVHSSLTGEPLFGHFAVTERPARVLYLCPEMGLLSFAKRIRNLGLMLYVGKTLFCRTMNSSGRMKLCELTTEELTGSLVVIDTAVRFVEGNEDSSEDMKVFAGDCFRLMKSGAASVLVLFHSPKGTKDASELTLENAMRGSGELGAFVSSCWATRLQDTDDPWESASYLKNVKQRDFESDPFEVKSDKCGRLHIVAAPSANVVLNGKTNTKEGNEEAEQVIRDNPTLSQKKIVLKLKEMGIERSTSWVGNKRFELLNVGVKTSVG